MIRCAEIVPYPNQSITDPHKRPDLQPFPEGSYGLLIVVSLFAGMFFLGVTAKSLGMRRRTFQAVMVLSIVVSTMLVVIACLWCLLS